MTSARLRRRVRQCLAGLPVDLQRVVDKHHAPPATAQGVTPQTPAALPYFSAAKTVWFMHLTDIEMAILAATVRAVERKPNWNLSDGWPPTGAVWRVAPLPLAIEILMAHGHPTHHLCRALTNHVTGAGDSPWGFVPGDAVGEIWLVRPPGGWLAQPTS